MDDNKKRLKETDRGFEEQKDGYKVVSQDPKFQELRDEFMIPFACHGCNSLMTHWDDAPFYRTGVCANCEIDWVKSDRAPDDIKKDRKKLRQFIKQKLAEKLNK